MTIDLTGIATSSIAGIFAVLGVVLPLLIASRVKNAAAASTLDAAVKNSLGAIEQAATLSVTTLKPSIAIPGVDPGLASAVQYVIDHAGAEATAAMKTTAFTSLPVYIADKVSAQIGLAKIAATQTSTPLAPSLAAASHPVVAAPPPPVVVPQRVATVLASLLPTPPPPAPPHAA